MIARARICERAENTNVCLNTQKEKANSDTSFLPVRASDKEVKSWRANGRAENILDHNSTKNLEEKVYRVNFMYVKNM